MHKTLQQAVTFAILEHGKTNALKRIADKAKRSPLTIRRWIESAELDPSKAYILAKALGFGKEKSLKIFRES